MRYVDTSAPLGCRCRCGKIRAEEVFHARAGGERNCIRKQADKHIEEEAVRD